MELNIRKVSKSFYVVPNKILKEKLKLNGNTTGENSIWEKSKVPVNNKKKNSFKIIKSEEVVEKRYFLAI